MVAFGFAHPWMLLGLPLAAIPILVHLFLKRPVREVPWAATRFLLAAARKRSERLKLERIVLLAVRTLTILLVPVALAQPHGGADATVVAPAARHRLLVLDDSNSMNAAPGGRSRFEAAKDALRQVVEGAADGDSFQVLRTAGTERVALGHPTADRDRVLELLEGLSPSYGRVDPAETLREANALLAKVARSKRKEILIASDFQRSDWRPETGDPELAASLAALGEGTRVRTLRVGTATPNAAITGLAIDDAFLRPGRRAKIRVSLRQFGEPDPAGRQLDLLVDDLPVATRTVKLVPGEPTAAEFDYAFGEAGEYRVEARLSGDELGPDDVRRLVVDVRDRVRVLLIDGTPVATPPATFYLRSALDAGKDSSESGPFETTVLADTGFDGAMLERYDVVVLANVETLSDERFRRLRTFAAAGGGVVVALGDRVNVEDYSRRFFDPPDGGPVGLVLSDRVGDPAAPERAIGFRSDELDHPLVKPFAEQAGGGLGTDFVIAYARAAFDPVKSRGVETALRFDTGDPAVVVMPVGSGRVVLLATSVDTTWAGPWPQIGRSFLPLVHEIIRYAAAAGSSARSLNVGEPIAWTSTEDYLDFDATVRDPAGEESVVRVRRSDDALRTRFDGTARPGFYTLDLPPPIGRTRTYAVNVDAGESDLAAASPEEMSDLLPNARGWEPGGEPPVSGEPSWFWSLLLLTAVAGLLLAEPVLDRDFGRGLKVLALVAATLTVAVVAATAPFRAAALAAVAVLAVAAFEFKRRAFEKRRV